MDKPKNRKISPFIPQPTVGGTNPPTQPSSQSLSSSPTGDNPPTPRRTEEDILRSLEEQSKRIDAKEKDIEKINTLLFFGFIILLAMLSQICIQLIIEKTNSYTILIDKIDDLKFQQFLQKQNMEFIRKDKKNNGNK